MLGPHTPHCYGSLVLAIETPTHHTHDDTDTGITGGQSLTNINEALLHGATSVITDPTASRRNNHE